MLSPLILRADPEVLEITFETIKAVFVSLSLIMILAYVGSKIEKKRKRKKKLEKKIDSIDEKLANLEARLECENKNHDRK